MASILSNKLIEDGDMSASFQSEHIQLAQRGGFAIHAVFTGSPVGSVYVSVSINGTEWVLLPDSTVAVTEAGDIFYNVADSKYLLARLHYARTSGSGTMDATVSVKEL
jgi:hypothetical protein